MIEFMDLRERLLYDSLVRFYSVTQNLDFLIPVLNQTSNVSLRILDWLVTNYSKKNNSWYEIYKDGRRQIFNIHLNYKNQLKAYSKKYFDPFCRRERIEIPLNVFCNKKGTIETTIGQLNFFRWVIENKMFNYVILNLEKIDNDMNFTLAELKNTSVKKRKELSKNTSKSLQQITLSQVISFE